MTPIIATTKFLHSVGNCYFARSNKGRTLKFIFDQFQNLNVNISKEDDNISNEYKALKPCNLPRELKGATPKVLEAIIREGSFQVLPLSNGDEVLKLNFGLKGGMIRRQDIQNQLRGLEGHAQLVNSIDRDLANVQARGIGSLGGTAIIGGAAAAGAVAGLVIGGGVAYGIAFLLAASNPVGWAVGGAVLIGTGCGIAAGLFAGSRVKKNRLEADQVHTQVQHVLTEFHEVQLLVNRHGPDHAGCRARINDLTNYLVEAQYLNTFTPYRTSLNENKFNRIRSFYSEDADQKVLEVKFMIICVLFALPVGHRPVDDLSRILGNLIDQIHDQAIRNYSLAVVGRLELDRQDYQRALTYFQRIPRESDLFAIAQEWIRDIQQRQRQL